MVMVPRACSSYRGWATGNSRQTERRRFRGDPPPFRSVTAGLVGPGRRRKRLVALELVLDAFADLLGVSLDLVGLAFRFQTVIVSGVARCFLGLAAEVFRCVTDLVSEAHGGGLLSFPLIKQCIFTITRSLLTILSCRCWGRLLIAGARG
ncbi:hypothetical protein ARTHRO9AX_200093 [Arthrobacter sp. 9AX]|nr:hypothetical protein ARTHRO9AX_200093 [Arthrobacter sp. 9AX]